MEIVKLWRQVMLYIKTYLVDILTVQNLIERTKNCALLVLAHI